MMPKADRDTLIARRGAFQASLLGWYRIHARRLPWREAPSLYKTVVSEFMLQQTQVKTVIPYFARWMAALPDWEALASAPEPAVLKLWEGLGYYSRARRLRRLARLLAARGRVPSSREAWLELPGIGPYTAAAVASMAFGEPAACVDGNVVRVLARLTADGTLFRDAASAARGFAGMAGLLLPPHSPGDFNQAMMELGATVCVRENPRCGACPVAGFCGAARRGRPAAFPRFASRRPGVRSVVRLWCVRRGALLLHRRPESARRLTGLYELPTPKQLGLESARAKAGPLLAARRRSITRFRIREWIHSAPCPRGRLRPGLAWIALARLDDIVLSGPHRRWVGEILALNR
jgi:A/G-specific adenine glycosylase